MSACACGGCRPRGIDDLLPEEMEAWELSSRIGRLEAELAAAKREEEAMRARWRGLILGDALLAAMDLQREACAKAVEATGLPDARACAAAARSATDAVPT